MDLKKLRAMTFASAVALMLSACGPDPTKTAAPAETPPATVTPDYGLYDDNIDTFLGEYVRESEMFADDELEYDVEQGVVTVTGELDSQEELTALQARVRRVPGVRDLNVAGVRVDGSD